MCINNKTVVWPVYILILLIFLMKKIGRQFTCNKDRHRDFQINLKTDFPSDCLKQTDLIYLPHDSSQFWKREKMRYDSTLLQDNYFEICN